MGKTGEQFLRVREMESLNYSSDFSKKDAKKVGTKLADNLIESGELDITKVIGNLSRLKEVVTAAEAKLKTSTEIETAAIGSQSSNGVKFSSMNTADILDFEKDPIYKEINAKLKDRKEKLTQAYKSYQKGGEKIYTEGYDEESGELMTYPVPVVPIKTAGKQVIKLQY